MDDVQIAYLQELQKHAIAMVEIAMKAARACDGNMNTAVAMLANCFSMQIAAMADAMPDEDAE